MFRMSRWTVAIALLLLVGAACTGDDSDDGDGDAASTPVIDPGDGGDYNPVLDPASFVPRIDNPYLPLTPGSRWVYESDDGSERIEVVVLEETREILGITATIVRDTVTEDGEVIEDTLDWFAQDADGNVWYLGEDSRDFEDGEQVSTEGSWEAGVDGAKAGIVMPATLTAGFTYRQEYYEGEAEDLGQVIRVDGSETVGGTAYTELLVTREWNPLEPEVVEEKYYARGTGLVLEQKVSGEEGRVELVSYEPAS